MKYIKNHENTQILVSVFILLLVSAGTFTVAPVLRRPVERFINYYYGDKELRDLMKKAKSEAKLVLVGTIAGMREESHGAMEQGDATLISSFIYRFKVESVERGEYKGSDLEAYMGWGSNRALPTVYPAGVKTAYKTGDRVRAFLSYGDVFGHKNDPHYFAPYSYFCLEPLDFQLDSLLKHNSVPPDKH